MTVDRSGSGSESACLSAETLQRLVDDPSGFVHIITIATKPDIIKQAPVYLELKRRGQQVLLCHTGQHHDHRYSGAMLEEFGLVSDVQLGVTGSLHDKVAQIIASFGNLLRELLDRGLTPIPYIHGDTATSMAVGVGSYLQKVACVHVEAGIRTITPRREVYDRFYGAYLAGSFTWVEYAAAQRDLANFERGSREPFPEQFNTRVSDAATGYHAAPVELAKTFLLDEGFPADTIDVVGNTVTDATEAAIRDGARATIFDVYPQIRGGRFIRMCVHRRENTEDAHRFTVLFDAMERLVRDGRSVLFIRLFGTEMALNAFGLRERLTALEREFPETFISSLVWPHYRDVIAAMMECALVATDSGSMQEEMSILGIPCVTLRFGTDRGESVLAGANILAPPIDSGFVATVIEGALTDEAMANVGNLYGTQASRRVVDGVLQRLVPAVGLFRSEEQRLDRGSWRSQPSGGSSHG